MKTHSDTSPVCRWGLGGRKLPPSSRPTRIPPGHPWHSRRASETKLVCSRLGLRPLPTETPRALCTTCDSGYPYLVSIPADSLDVRGASEFFAPSWPRLGVHQLGEMMRLTGGWEGKEALADFIVYSLVLQSPRKREKKCLCQLCLISMVPCVSLCFHHPLHFSLLVVNNIQDGP